MGLLKLNWGTRFFRSKNGLSETTDAPVREITRLLFDGQRIFHPESETEYAWDGELSTTGLFWNTLEKVKTLEIHYQGPDALFLLLGDGSISQNLRQTLPPDRGIEDYLLTFRDDKWVGLLLKSIAQPWFDAAVRLNWETCVFVMFPCMPDGVHRLEIGEVHWLLEQKDQKIHRLLPLPELVEGLARPPAELNFSDFRQTIYPSPLFIWREPGWKQRQEAARHRIFLKRYALFCLALLLFLAIGLRGGIAWYQKKWVDSSLAQQQISTRDRKLREQKQELEAAIAKIQALSDRRIITQRNHGIIFRKIMAATPEEFMALESISAEIENGFHWQIKGFALESHLIPKFHQKLEAVFPAYTISLENMVQLDEEEARAEGGMHFRFTLEMVAP